MTTRGGSAWRIRRSRTPTNAGNGAFGRMRSRASWSFHAPARLGKSPRRCVGWKLSRIPGRRRAGPSRGRWRRVDIPHAARRAAGHRQGVQLRGCRPAALTGARPRRRAAKEYLPMTASHPAKLRAIAKALGVDASIFDEEGSAALQLDNVPSSCSTTATAGIRSWCWPPTSASWRRRMACASILAVGRELILARARGRRPDAGRGAQHGDAGPAAGSGRA